ncbi:MAG: hypothetical protein RL518_561 [Pseudomonadota bacterium]|jgi:hypothetical protein
MGSLKDQKLNIQEAESLKDLMPPAKWTKEVYRGRGDEIPDATEKWVMKRSFIREILRASIAYFSKDPNRPLLYSDIFNETYNGGLTPYSLRGYHFQYLGLAVQRGLLVITKVPVSEHNTRQMYMLRQEERFLADLKSALESNVIESSSTADKMSRSDDATPPAPSNDRTIRIQLSNYDDYQIIPTQQAISFLRRSERLLAVLEAESTKE